MNRSKLFIERLVITKSDKYVYDETFHRGLNVIRGDHSVGKTTILEMIFYVLGGEIKENQWLYPADKCDEIYCQININNNVFTIKREIEKKSIMPIHIRSGEYDSKEYSSESWKVYGPRRSTVNNRKSFSQQFFELLGWETHKSDDYANLTMHQILRLLYVDQETASTKLLRAEDNPRGDSESIRTAIFEFLLGLDNLDTHQLRQQLLIANRDFEQTSADLSAMYRVLGEDSSLTLEILESKITENTNEIVKLRDIPLDVDTNSDFDKVKEQKFRELDKKIKLYNKQIQSLTNELTTLNGDLVDCELYEKSLLFRKKSLLESQASYDAIGLINYECCPCCLQELKQKDDGVCSLCNSPIDESKKNNNYMEILTELDFQINSNIKIYNDYKEHKSGLESAIRISKIKLTEAQSEQESVARMIKIAPNKALDNAKKIGYLESENKNLKNKVEIIKELDINKRKKVELNNRISELKGKIDAARASNKRRREKVYTGISKNIVSFLHRDKRSNDTPYEEVFEEAKASDVELDFARDRMLIDGRVKFSGSSNYIKKNAFHLSALLESLDDKNYRLPRFLMLDAIENGGMKEFRSHNFQKTITEYFKGRNDFQIIFCTSMVIDELDNELYGVGQYYESNVINITPNN